MEIIKTIFLIIILLIGVSFIVLFGINNYLNKEKEFNCNLVGTDVLYFKKNEIAYIPEFLDKNKHGIAIIPELNQLNANTEVLNCPNFRYSDYIDLGW